MFTIYVILLQIATDMTETFTSAQAPDTRHIDVSMATNAKSKIRCATKCHAQHGCQGYSFNQVTKVCYLVNGDDALDDSQVVSDAGFKYYKKEQNFN